MQKLGFAKFLWLKTVYLILTFRRHFSFSKSALKFSIFYTLYVPFQWKNSPLKRACFKFNYTKTVSLYTYISQCLRCSTSDTKFSTLEFDGFRYDVICNVELKEAKRDWKLNMKSSCRLRTLQYKVWIRAGGGGVVHVIVTWGQVGGDPGSTVGAAPPSQVSCHGTAVSSLHWGLHNNITGFC